MYTLWLSIGDTTYIWEVQQAKQSQCRKEKAIIENEYQRVFRAMEALDSPFNQFCLNHDEEKVWETKDDGHDATQITEKGSG